jgi:hypothetical protein
MKKVPAVERVRVSLKDGLTILDLKPNNTVLLAELRRIIKNNGFVSREATIVANGTISQDQKALVVSGTDERLDLASPAQRAGDAWKATISPPGPNTSLRGAGQDAGSSRTDALDPRRRGGNKT